MYSNIKVIDMKRAICELSYGCLVRHYKLGTIYIINNFSKDTNRDEIVVNYMSLIDGKIWSKPYSEFLEEVEDNKENPFKQKLKYTMVKLKLED